MIFQDTALWNFDKTVLVFRIPAQKFLKLGALYLSE